MVTRLSGFLRFTLDASPDDRVPLRREIEAQRHYLEIEKTRFADRLELEIEVDEGVSEALVPTMILQPLLENAVKHAVARSLDRVHGRGPGAMRVAGASRASGHRQRCGRRGGPGAGRCEGRAQQCARASGRALRRGSRLEAGPRPEGGFEVVIAMPLERDGKARGAQDEEEKTHAGIAG